MLFVIPIFSSQKIVLQDEYCIKESYLFVQDLDKQSQDSGILLSIPQNLSIFEISSIKIISLLSKRGYEVEDRSGGVVSLRRNCTKEEDFKVLKDELIGHFKKKYPTIQIDALQIYPANSLPADFTTFTLKKIHLPESKMHKNNSTFLAKFKTDNDTLKSIYFRYEIKAKVRVFQALRNLSKGESVKGSDIQDVTLFLEQLPPKPLLELKPEVLVAKFYIKKGTILSMNSLMAKPTVQKGAFVQAILQDGGLSLKIEAEALSDGYRGDIIRIRTKNGKVFKAVILDERRVFIR